MATTVGTQKEPVDLLKALIELDYDAIEAYRSAVDRLDDPTAKSKLAEFMKDHERHTRDLAPVVRELGGTPPTGGDVKQVLTQGKVVLADLAGDKAILKAMKTNEDDTNRAYERAVKHDGLRPGVVELLERNLDDERRHRAWIEERIAAS